MAGNVYKMQLGNFKVLPAAMLMEFRYWHEVLDITPQDLVSVSTRTQTPPSEHCGCWINSNSERKLLWCVLKTLLDCMLMWNLSGKSRC
jgi:hypothetical protein